MTRLARWSKPVVRWAVRPYRVMSMVVFLLLIAPMSAMAQTPVGSTLPEEVVDLVIAPELFDRATFAFEAQDFRRAELDYSLFILLNPTFSLAYYYRAQTLVSEGEIERAMHDFNQAVATSENLSESYISDVLTARAELLSQNSQFADALADYTQAISLEPSAIGAYVGRGLLYMEQNDLELARSDFDSAIGQNGTLPLLYAYRALITSQLDEPRAAAADYLEFLNLIETTSADEAAPASGNVVSIQMGLGVVHRLTFEAQAGQQLNAVAAGRNGTVDPLMVVVDSDGEALIADDDSGGNYSAVIEAFTIPADGTYTLVIGHSLGGYEGQVTVGIELLGEE